MVKLQTFYRLHEPLCSKWIWLRVSIFISCLVMPSTMQMEKAFVQKYLDKQKYSQDLHHHMKIGDDTMENQCSNITKSSVCPCYNFDDGLFLECPGATAVSLQNTLQMITSPIQSLSIYDFDRSVTSLSHDIFQPGVDIKHLQFSHSHLETLKDGSLKSIRTSLESLSIVNSKLVKVPKEALKGMQKLVVLDFDSNQMREIENYSFYGLRLVKLNLKGNQLETILEHAFAGLEESIAEIDLSENRLKIFPVLALSRLDYLRTLRLSHNKISTFYSTANMDTMNNSINFRLPLLTFLDLSSNQFEKITSNGFLGFPQLKTLSLYSNQIKFIHEKAFRILSELMSLDISHNRIVYLDRYVFEFNKRLQTIDLSHNHIHSISGVFSNLPQLREIFLSENNILELSGDSFTNSTNIDVIYLESNSIRHVDPTALNTLSNLEQLYLRNNYIKQIPVTFLDKAFRLTSLSLDNNQIQDLEIGMFRKLEHLREIRLHNNKIRRIRKGVFHPLPKLLELHIQENLIEEIDSGAFASLINLQHVNLQDNKLITIDNIFEAFNNSSTSNNNGNGNGGDNGNGGTNSNSNDIIKKPSSLLSIQLNTNLLTSIHYTTFKNQENIKIMWFNENRLMKIEKFLLKDLKYLERLYMSNNLIKEIEVDAFKGVRNLKFLDLSGNRLEKIYKNHFTLLENLEELDISRNWINTIDDNSFINLKKLKTLDLSNNPLKQINKNIFNGNLLSFTTLNLRNCSLNKIDSNSLRSLPNLSELDIEENNLNPMDIRNLNIPNLRNLRLTNNNLSNISELNKGIFDELRFLQEINLSNCGLTIIPKQLFMKNTNLVKLDLNNNYVKSIEHNIFTGLNVLKEIKLCNNLLNDFPHIAFYNISTLESLHLSGNRIGTIDFFKFSGLTNLRYLDLKDNRINSLTGFNAVNLTQLDFIDISGNFLSTLPGNFLRHSINLQRVDLSYNRFLQIPSSVLSETSLSRLFWLNLTGNPINKIYTVKDEKYPYLKELYICQTNLTILTSKDFEAFQSLQHLHLIQNRIMRISPGAFYSLSKLLTLDLSINELELMPKERLQGLKLLKLLNISHNSLKDLEEFSSDLIQLEILDLSFNQLDRIPKIIFRNLIKLKELYLMGNRITTISSDAFKHQKNLAKLDLRKNYLESVPLAALKSLETNVRSLKIEENPLHCNCDSQELWEWLRDHPKWSTEEDINYLRCEHPGEIRGKVFMKMEVQEFCDAPLILKLAIQDIQPYSVVVSWQSREHPGINGYDIIYHALDGVDEVRGKRLNGSANTAKLIKLSSGTRYLICVLGTGNWLNSAGSVAVLMKPPSNANETTINNRIIDDENNINRNVLPKNLEEILQDRSISHCAEVRTLDPTPSLITDENSLSGHGIIHSILTRRLGLIVGCCLGIIVFIVLISVLGYLKIKKQRIENIKRQHERTPPGYISYRQFSIPNDEHRNALAVNNSPRGGVISGGGVGGGGVGACIDTGIGPGIGLSGVNISNMSTTTTATNISHDNSPHSNYMPAVVLGTANLNAY